MLLLGAASSHPDEFRGHETRIIEAFKDVNGVRNVCETCINVIARKMKIARYPCGSPASCR